MGLELSRAPRMNAEDSMAAVFPVGNPTLEVHRQRHLVSVRKERRTEFSLGLTGRNARDGELGGNRTHDPRIKSALLYRLSYELTNKPLLSKYHRQSAS